ncbi:MAG: RagB/SusD family nutrient uptake outer membrane protein [Alistipes sp.]|nr:RagB/SusD family nutrient uptake outer membrane protein [Alistipes sp.]
MKFSKIFKTTAVALGAVVALSGCIRETFPKEGTITQGQLMAGQMEVVAENLLKGIPSGLLTYISGWEHTDFGYHSVGIYNDHACGLITSNGHLIGLPAGYDRFYLAAYSWSYAPNGNMPAHVWYNYYPQIKSCNDLIKVLEGNEQLKHYAGIARTYRAMMYLDLARMYECLPAANDNNPDYFADQLSVAGLTVPIVDENLDEAGAKQNPRATREEIFNFIFADLAFAEEALAEYVPTMFSNPDLSVVYGLYARAYLWLGGFDDMYSGELPKGNAAYAKAGEYARKAIEAHGGAIMSEAEWTSVTNGFNVVASSWMWGLQQSVDTVINNLFQFVAHMAPEASYGYAPLSQLGVSAKDYERLGDGDFRKKLIKGPETTYAEFAPYTSLSADEFASFAPYVNFKFRPAGGNRTEYKAAGATVLPLMRCEEMYFIEMEAAYHTQGFDAALTLLSQFMANRDSSYRVQTQDLLDEIIFQKGIEFWGEGIKMYDMKRLNKGYDSAYNGTNFPPDARFVIEGRAPWWSYCIPKGETDLNKAAAEQGANPNPSQAFDPILPME